MRTWPWFTWPNNGLLLTLQWVFYLEKSLGIFRLTDSPVTSHEFVAWLFNLLLPWTWTEVYLTSEGTAVIIRCIAGCQYGWEYDGSWFSRTVPSQENWVCDKDLYVTNTFVATQVGDAVGTISFGHMSDR